MESYRTRSGVRTKSSIYYLVLDEEAGAVPVRISGKMEAEMDRIMDETRDYLKGGCVPEPASGNATLEGHPEGN